MAVYRGYNADGSMSTRDLPSTRDPRPAVDVRVLQTLTGSQERGIGRYTLNLVRDLVEYGDSEPLLVSRTGKALPGELQELDLPLAPVEGRMWMDRPPVWWRNIPKVRSNASLLRKHFGKLRDQQEALLTAALEDQEVDLVHFPSGVDLGSYPWYSGDLPVVTTFLDAIVLRYREFFFDRMDVWHQDHYLEQLENLKHAEAIIAISHSAREDCIQYAGVNPNKVFVAYPSVSPWYAHPRPVSSIKKWVRGMPYFLFNSVADPHKNASRVVEAFAKADLEECLLVMVTPAKGPEAEILRGVIDRCGVAGRAVMTGWVDEDALIALYQNAIALVSPSLIEGFGLPVAQAMTAGTPVITSNRYAQAEISKGAAVQIDPESVDEIAWGFTTLYDDLDLRVKLAEAGRARSTSFSPQAQAEKVLGVYRTVAG